MEYRINNAEFVLLALIAEVPAINGYHLREQVTQRGMAAWAGVSASSIYVVVKKLEKWGYIRGAEDTAKQSKGPRGRVFTVQPQGQAALIEAIKDGLSRSREDDKRFNIALSGIGFLAPAQAVACLRARQAFLKAEQQRLTHAAAAQQALPLAGRLLFARIISAIKAEQAWLKTAVQELDQKGDTDAVRA